MRLLLAELYPLKQQIDIEREAKIITFDFSLTFDTIMSYCMSIVRQLNLTFPPRN